MQRAVFFDRVRVIPFGGSLSQTQVDGMTAILDAADRHSITDARHLAYALATTFHETGRTMAPVVENLNYSAAGLRSTFSKYFSAAQAEAYARQPERIANRAYANRMGNGGEASGDGWRYRGRGYVQLTGRDNYAKAGKKIGADLVAYPNLATMPINAARIMFVGMAEGWFTGKRLDDYFSAAADNPKGARRIINGTDKADLIAGFHRDFLAALTAAGWSADHFVDANNMVPPDPLPPPPDIEPAAPPSGAVSFWARLFSALARMFRK